jgi:hypothetical protein
MEADFAATAATAGFVRTRGPLGEPVMAMQAYSYARGGANERELLQVLSER